MVRIIRHGRRQVDKQSSIEHRAKYFTRCMNTLIARAKKQRWNVAELISEDERQWTKAARKTAPPSAHSVTPASFADLARRTSDLYR
jgi:hypothetical protein